MRSRPALTSADVQKMMAACKAEAEKNKWNVTIAIVDDSGAALLLERMDGAGPISAKVAMDKALTSALTRRPRSKAMGHPAPTHRLPRPVARTLAWDEDPANPHCAGLSDPAGLGTSAGAGLLHVKDHSS